MNIPLLHYDPNEKCFSEEPTKYTYLLIKCLVASEQAKKQISKVIEAAENKLGGVTSFYVAPQTIQLCCSCGFGVVVSVALSTYLDNRAINVNVVTSNSTVLYDSLKHERIPTSVREWEKLFSDIRLQQLNAPLKLTPAFITAEPVL